MVTLTHTITHTCCHDLTPSHALNTLPTQSQTPIPTDSHHTLFLPSCTLTQTYSWTLSYSYTCREKTHTHISIDSSTCNLNNRLTQPHNSSTQSYNFAHQLCTLVHSCALSYTFACTHKHIYKNTLIWGLPEYDTDWVSHTSSRMSRHSCTLTNTNFNTALTLTLILTLLLD